MEYQSQNRERERERSLHFLLRLDLGKPILIILSGLHLDHMLQRIGPRINGPGQTPMHAIIIQSHILSGPMPVSTRVPIGSEQHHLGRIQHPPFLLLPLSLRNPKFLQLRHVEIQIHSFQNRLVAPERPPPHAVAALIPQPTLEVRRRERAEERHAAVVPPPVHGSERRPEGAAVAVGHGEAGDVGELAVVAAGDAAVLVVDGGAGEPVAGVDDDVVELVDVTRPRLVRLVQVEVEEAGAGRAFGASLFGSY